MHPRLEESPRAWRRFALQVCAVFALAGVWFAWRGSLQLPAFLSLLVALAIVALAAVVRPVWFRSPYRGGMIASAWLGEHVGRVLLTAFFFLAVAPLGLVLRALGHDPLALRRRADESSYWRPARPQSDLTKLH